MALLDTGSDYGVISKHLATHLGLCAVGIESMRMASGTARRPVFAATVTLGAAGGLGQRTFQCQRLIEGDLADQPFDLVLGRSILQHGLFLTVGQEFFFWIDADSPQGTW